MGDEDPSGIVMKGKKTAYPGSHSTDIITKKALDWFKETRDENRPFFYMLHYKAPHDLWQHAHRYDDYLEDVKIPEPDNLLDHSSGRSPALDQSLQNIASSQRHMNFTPEIMAMEPGYEKRKFVYQEYMKRYLRCVKGIDDNLGKVFAYLDESGLADNTIVIYTADQGFFLGEHGLYDKRFIYEEALRIPLIVRWPHNITAGQVREELILNLDFPETILDIAGQSVPNDMQGRSFLPILRGERIEDWRNSFYYRYYYSHFDTPPHFGIRSTDQKLIYYDSRDEWEFYDLRSDPTEMHDLSKNPAWGNRMFSMKTELTQLQKQVGDNPNDIGDNPRTGNAALDQLERDRAARNKK
jgi:arylsulfatase A-like enzyme